MIIVQVAGGLGNQLQQYALYRKLLSLGKDAKLDISWFDSINQEKKIFAKRELELAYFEQLDFEACTSSEKEKLIGKEGILGKVQRKLLPGTVHLFRESQMYHPEIFQMEDMYIIGYFACEKYYADILHDLRKTIHFPTSNKPENLKMAEIIQTCEAVSVHIRRGDYLDAQNIALFGNICTEDYYQQAIGYIKEHCFNPHFFIFSDDVNYAQEHFVGEECTVVDINCGRDSFYDMWLMSQCKHNICANSTFSFWGARLNPNEDKIMIRPTIHRNNQVFVKEEMEELWSGWTFVSPQGQLINE